MKLKDVYNRHFLEAELIISIIVSLVLIFIMISIWSVGTIEHWISINKETIYPLIATLGGTLLGFIITGISILLAFSESERLRVLKQHRLYETIFKVYFSTIKYLAITTLSAISAIVINNGLSFYIFCFLLWSIIISALRIWRCFWILENIVGVIYKHKKQINKQ